MQALGSSITYMRRYLWQLALDIIEADDIDPNIGAGSSTTAAPAPAAAPKTTKKPATPAQRTQVKEDLTSTSAPADELQIKGLKNALKQLMELDAEQESFVQEIAVKTDGFTNITKEQCEALVNGVAEMIARTAVAVALVPVLGYAGACCANPAAWIAADLFLFPCYLHVSKRLAQQLGCPYRKDELHAA